MSLEGLLVGEDGEVKLALWIVDDPEFINLFGQLDKLDHRDEEALTRARVQDAIRPRSA